MAHQNAHKKSTISFLIIQHFALPPPPPSINMTKTTNLPQTIIVTAIINELNWIVRILNLPSRYFHCQFRWWCKQTATINLILPCFIHCLVFFDFVVFCAVFSYCTWFFLIIYNRYCWFRCFCFGRILTLAHAAAVYSLQKVIG